MALSLQSIYRPVNDFFLNKYKTDTASPIFFRFDKFGSVIADDDFTDAAEAQETFSDLTNRLPVEDSNGIYIFFGASLIDSEYRRLLSASIPFVDPTDPNKEAIIDAFIKIKAEGNREWERLSLPRGAGVVDDYRASFAFPVNWYDRNNNEIWTKQSFEIKESVSAPVDARAESQLWKLKLDDAHLERILPALTTVEPSPIELRRDVVRMRPILTRAGPVDVMAVHDHRTRPLLMVEPAAAASPRLLVRPAAGPQLAGPQVMVRAPGALAGAGATPVRQNLTTSLHRLELTNRLVVVHYIRENAPTQPSTTSSLKITFEYCGVNIRRPWMMDGLTKNKSWFIPGFAKGQETARNSTVNLSILPIGFIAIKNLSIEANWSELDISTSKGATDFGPFEVRSEIIDNKLSHEGVQIIGWLVQHMPELPPNDPPAIN